MSDNEAPKKADKQQDSLLYEGNFLVAMNMGQYDDHFAHKSRDLLDLKLVSRVQKGDREAFDLLLVKYQNKTAAIVSRYVDEPSEIADVTQEIFLRAYRSIHSFRSDSTFYTWLFRIAVNYAKTYIQKQKTKKANQSSQDNLMNELPKNLSHLESAELLPGRSQLEYGVENALKVMPAELSVALVLREFDDLCYEEISKVMECPVGTVRSRIFRARELLDNTIKSLSECE